MTAGLMGGGTQNDPWLVSSREQLAAVLRDRNTAGFYRLTGNFFVGVDPLALEGLLATSTEAAGYLPKVIDLNGYPLKVTMARPQSGACAVISAVHFLRGVIEFDLTLTNTSQTVYVLYMCFVTDCAIRGRVAGSGVGSATVNLFYSELSHPALIAREIKRVVITELGSPATSITRFNRTYITTAVPISEAYVMGAVSNMRPGFTSRSSLIALVSLPAAFIDSGWWESTGLLYPYQQESIELSIETRVAGESASRLVWLQNDRVTTLLGLTDPNGQGYFLVNIRRGTPFTLFASEDLIIEALHAGSAIVAGGWYMPPTFSAYVYQASISGVVPSLNGVSFGGEPIIIEQITLTPLLRHAATASRRLSVDTDSSVISLALDTTSGGGAVIDGDPAYLDGVVEEIHPMTGTRQALANCEVVAFERRGSDYVAMGSAYSDGIGGFRLETEVYGGGDVFAFAADFPGVIFQPGAPLNVGDRIRPALANGYVYEIIQPGTAGAAEPVWWPDQGNGTEGDIGTARARARPYYQPVGHGPLKMTLIE